MRKLLFFFLFLIVAVAAAGFYFHDYETRACVNHGRLLLGDFNQSQLNHREVFGTYIQTPEDFRKKTQLQQACEEVYLQPSEVPLDVSKVIKTEEMPFLSSSTYRIVISARDKSHRLLQVLSSEGAGKLKVLFSDSDSSVSHNN